MNSEGGSVGQGHHRQQQQQNNSHQTVVGEEGKTSNATATTHYRDACFRFRIAYPTKVRERGREMRQQQYMSTFICACGALCDELNLLFLLLLLLLLLLLRRARC